MYKVKKQERDRVSFWIVKCGKIDNSQNFMYQLCNMETICKKDGLFIYFQNVHIRYFSFLWHMPSR